MEVVLGLYLLAQLPNVPFASCGKGLNTNLAVIALASGEISGLRFSLRWRKRFSRWRNLNRKPSWGGLVDGILGATKKGAM